MDFLTGKIKPIYFKYLTAAFGSALITSIYSMVDMAMVGKYQGPDGTAALAVVMPVWNIIYSLGLLMGIGGSVLFSMLRGASEENKKESNEFFTTSVIGAIFLAAIIWIGLIFFDKQLLTLFGAEESLLDLARWYVLPVKFVVPAFLFTQMLAAFLRNDNDPGLATKAVLIGGVFNVFGDYLCVFTLDWGLFGAGFATACGSVISLVVMLTHFFGKKNTLKLVWPKRFVTKIRKLVVTGFSTFFIDVAMGILTILFNRQILKYLGTDALSVYGVIINISTFAQCCAYSIGQAAQPIISINFGAEKGERIRETLKYALGTVAFFALFWTVLSMAVPNLYTNIFMTPTEKILEIAPSIIRCYSISFILLPLNIFSTYYFQALMKPAASFVVSVGWGAVISGILIFLLPVVAGADAIWFAMPITELSEQYVQQIIEHHPLTSFPIHIGRSFHYPAINPVVQQQQKVHMEQSRLIRELAEQSDCVIVGRCADQILSELEPFRIFVYADMDSKIRRCMEKATEKEPLTERELKKHIMDIDRARAKYYSFYTNRKWGDKLNYDLCINTTGLVIREIVPVIAKMF